MRNLKSLLFFFVIFLLFFTAGAISASLFNKTQGTLIAVAKSQPHSFTQTALLLYKQSDQSKEIYLPESIDLLIIKYGNLIDIHLVHLYPTDDEILNILYVSELTKLPMNNYHAELESYLGKLKNISINGTIRYDDLTEKSINEMISISLKQNEPEDLHSNLLSTLCRNVNETNKLVIGNFNLHSLYPRHIQTSIDARSLMLLALVNDSSTTRITCESFR